MPSPQTEPTLTQKQPAKPVSSFALFKAENVVGLIAPAEPSSVAAIGVPASAPAATPVVLSKLVLKWLAFSLAVSAVLGASFAIFRFKAVPFFEQIRVSATFFAVSLAVYAKPPPKKLTLAA